MNQSQHISKQSYGTLIFSPQLILLCLLSVILTSTLSACEGGENETVNLNTAGVMAEAGETATEAGGTATEAGETATEAGETTTEAGETATEAGETATEAGETATEAGETATEAGNDIIIETNEGGEDWMDPQDFGEVGQGIHAFTMTDIDGEEVDMRRYRGRVALVVNVASRCGYTPQYTDLQRLYSEYRERGLVILGFPANNFNGQEPGTEEEIAAFCTANYGVTFPMFSKISVKGADIHPLYTYLTTESGREVSWNFNKFLVGRDGLFVQHYSQQVVPYADELIAALEAQLANE